MLDGIIPTFRPLISGAGVDTLIGCTGNNLFYVSYGSPAGITMIGGIGMNKRRDDYVTDISQADTSRTQT